MDNQLLNTDKAADYLGVSRSTLPVWRCTKRVPLPYVKIGRKVLYQKSDLDAFIAKQTVQPAASDAA